MNLLLSKVGEIVLVLVKLKIIHFVFLCFAGGMVTHANFTGNLLFDIVVGDFNCEHLTFFSIVGSSRILNF